MTAESVADFLDGMEIELDDLALPDGVLDLSGIAAPEEETEGDDDAPDVDEDGEPDSQPGEMYELGNSILLCGDSTNPEDVARILGGLKADLVFTDPPYGMKKENDGVANDNDVDGSVALTPKEKEKMLTCFSLLRLSIKKTSRLWIFTTTS